MKILFFDWKSYGKELVVKAMEELGHQVHRVQFEHEKDNDDEEYRKKAIKLLSFDYYDIVFSLNYFSAIAIACHENRVPYISWLYDSPLMQVWNKSAYYPENTIFSFDQSLCDALRAHGVERVFYMPLAADATHIEELSPTKEQIERFSGDVSFVGNFYDKETDIKKAVDERMIDFFRGYSDAVISAQSEISGWNFLEDMAGVEDIATVIEGMIVNEPEAPLFASVEMLYANYYLAPEVTKKERRGIVRAVAEKYNMNVYTNSDISMIPKAVNKGGVDYYSEMPLVFRYSKINLNITLRSIKTGIPLRGLDIMASGGFLLTNYQEDFLKHFIPGEDFVYYLNKEDLLEKIEYYLTHEEERKRIARNGFEKVRKYHSYKDTIEKMLDFALGGKRKI